MSQYEGKLKIFTGNASRDLGEKICEELQMELGNCEVGRFSDGEVFVTINESVRGQDVFIIQSTSHPTNDHLMEVLVMIDALKRASAGRINAVIPYYGYARQDRKARARDPITAKLVADLLTVAGADRVLTMDLHAAQIQGYFDFPVDHLLGLPILAKYFLDKRLENIIVVSPDLGSVNRARQLADILHCSIAIIEKRRAKPNESEVLNIIGDIEGKTAILCDDMIDTGGTLVNGANYLKAKGAKEVYACATHPVFSGPAVERMIHSEIKEIVVTDTIKLPAEKMFDKLKVVTVSKAFAQAIRCINENKSVSQLFMTNK